MHVNWTRPAILRLASVVIGASLIAACGGQAHERSHVLVSAASSLTDAFADIEEQFEATHPGADVLLNFGGSSLLREQILGGAPVDVFASANPAVMQTVADAGFVIDSTIFANNRLQIGVPNDNPAGVVGIKDFADHTLLIGLCAETVPCGSLARDVLAASGVDPSIDTNEPDVRSLLTKLEVGELDAGIVYTTDIIATREVTGIEIPDAVNPIAQYPIATLADAPNSAGAEEFVAFVLSAEGQRILATHGFLNP